MFDQLGTKLRETVKKLRGQARLTEDNISDALREVRMALLEADVALPVVKSFAANVRQKAIGADVLESLSPGQALVKVVNDELVNLMGSVNDELNLSARPPAVILVAGLQGAGKTTTVAKLAQRLKTRDGKRVMICSADVYRPAAIEQLAKLASDIEVDFCASDAGQKPVQIARHAVDEAKRRVMDVLLVDTAGRLHVDEQLMDEIQKIHGVLDPVETLFVVDSTTGQDAVNSARAFDEALPLTGVILTKVDGDARGGAALSVRQITGKPIKFMGIGESTTALEAFYPDRVASRILGMGDIVGLVEEVTEKVDKKKADKLARKIKKGKGFSLADFKDQLEEMEKMGGIASLMKKMPGMADLPQGAIRQVNDNQSIKMIAIINSMTPQERQFPAVIRNTRKRRIAAGSGTQVQDVNRLLKQFMQMQKMMKRMGKKGGMTGMMRGMKGRIPGGMPF